MVKICDAPYVSSSYDSYFESFSFPLSDFQKYAIESIVTGNHVLVTAHTGSGKTLPAEFALQHFVGLGKKVIYTSPIKALSNQKFYEFTNKYPHISFGLMTGDIKTNPNADVLIMTTEILMNYLFIQGQSQTPSTSPFGNTELSVSPTMLLRNISGSLHTLPTFSSKLLRLLPSEMRSSASHLRCCVATSPARSKTVAVSSKNNP